MTIKGNVMDDWGDDYTSVHLMWCVGCQAHWVSENDDDCTCSCATGDRDYERWVAFEVPVRAVSDRATSDAIDAAEQRDIRAGRSSEQAVREP